MTRIADAFSSCDRARCRRSAAVSPVCPRARQNEPGCNVLFSAMCYLQRARPARRRSSSSKHRHQPASRIHSSWSIIQSLTFAILFGLLFQCTRVEAGNVHSPRRRMDRDCELLYDRSEPPVPRMHLNARQEISSSVSSLVPTQTAAGTASTATSNAPLETATSPASSTLPRPFDTNIGNNFTSASCPEFFTNFLSNDDFKACLPFSLLLQTSNGFFADAHSPVRLTEALDATCHVNVTQCSTLMGSLAQQIQLQSNCGADLQMQNPLVQQAYNGLVAYEPLYHAGCLTDSNGAYCYADAVTNASALSSSYVYFLPLGVQLPANSRLACNACLQDTMAVFATYASNSSSPLSDDYDAAAQMVDASCGQTFTAAAVHTTSAAVRGLTNTHSSALLGTFALLVVLAAHIFI